MGKGHSSLGWKVVWDGLETPDGYFRIALPCVGNRWNDICRAVVSAIGSEKKQKAASSQMVEQQEQQAAKGDVPLSKASMDLGGSIVPPTDVGTIGERSRKPDQTSWEPPSDEVNVKQENSTFSKAPGTRPSPGSTPSSPMSSAGVSPPLSMNANGPIAASKTIPVAVGVIELSNK
uniref:Uncharacterized protein n=1 Tax=Parascaris equorum TaxID=6256 RepID=A0A914R8T4_PAREQ